MEAGFGPRACVCHPWPRQSTSSAGMEDAFRVSLICVPKWKVLGSLDLTGNEGPLVLKGMIIVMPQTSVTET